MDASPPTSPVTTIKVSRKVMPSGMTYDQYVTVYRQLLDWIKTVRLVDESHPAYEIEGEFLKDHTKLQKYVTTVY